jgi:uncharacterized protein (DUF2132 family)
MLTCLVLFYLERIYLLLANFYILAVVEENKQKNNPLHGITLETILQQLSEVYSWPELFEAIPIQCFNVNPSVSSSLKFLRKTPWARNKVEHFYLFANRKGKLRS